MLKGIYSEARALIFLLIAVATLAPPAAAKDKIFRGRDGNVCDLYMQLDKDGQEPTTQAASDCMVGRYKLKEAHGNGPSNSYSLAFLEYGGLGGDLLDERQLRSVHEIVDSPRQKYIVVFVHGWHHNASRNDRDVKRMHVFLSYTRSFLNQRPDYRDTELIGIYVGWNAAVRDSGYKFPLDHLSYAAKKRESDRIAPAVVSDLREISDKLRLGVGNPTADKMLVIGHSFGGNVLATGLKDHILSQLDTYGGNKVIKPPLGDLTVLINPASEARKFNEIQRAIREKNIDFPVTQPPGYMSLTATEDWNEEEFCKRNPEAIEPRRRLPRNQTNCLAKNKAEPDDATGKAFKVGQMLLNHKFAREDYTAIGHYSPTRDNLYGATHDLTAIKGSEHKTHYWNGTRPEMSTCNIAPEWLPALRKGNQNWDTLYTNSTIIDRRESKQTAYQLRAYLFRDSTPAVFSARIGNEPYWNVRTLPNLIVGHSSFVSYMMMCMLNQFVLDDPGGVYRSKS